MLVFCANLKPIGNRGCHCYIDYNSNEQLDSGEPSAVTSSAGFFNISLSLAAVRFRVG